MADDRKQLTPDEVEAVVNSSDDLVDEFKSGDMTALLRLVERAGGNAEKAKITYRPAAGSAPQ